MCGVPNWAMQLHSWIAEKYKKENTVVWIVSDYRFHNYEYNELINLPAGQLLYDSPNYVRNPIDKDYMTPMHTEFLVNHTLKIIDTVIAKYPNIKLIFWCLYKRTKANTTSSYPSYAWYDEIKKRYANHIIDIDNYTTPEEFNTSLICDESAHPNRAGYLVLDKMIRSINSPRV